MRASPKSLLAVAAVLGACALLVAGCGGSNAAAPTVKAPVKKATCQYRAQWQALANRVGAPVYCPGWLPDPLTSQLTGQWNSMNRVDPDKAYTESFIWQDTDTPGISGVLHAIFRGWPNRTKIPTCLGGIKGTTPVPCYGGPKGTYTANGITARFYTVNQDFDQWHIALLWHHQGSLYTISEHLAVPLDYAHVLIYLKRELRNLVLVQPTHAT